MHLSLNEEGRMSAKRVLSLGQCGADHGAISRLLASQFGAEVVAAATADEALAHLQRDDFALVLVNRILDYDGRSGLDFIARLKADEQFQSLPVMLVSNYTDAQAEAARSGALPGFGKSQLTSPTTVARLRPLLG
jgi:two-component system chemotaxis response regulator CheY